MKSPVPNDNTEFDPVYMYPVGENCTLALGAGGGATPPGDRVTFFIFTKPPMFNVLTAILFVLYLIECNCAATCGHSVNIVSTY